MPVYVANHSTPHPPATYTGRTKNQITAHPTPRLHTLAKHKSLPTYAAPNTGQESGHTAALHIDFTREISMVVSCWSFGNPSATRNGVSTKK